jgi:hypothetical protein
LYYYGQTYDLEIRTSSMNEDGWSTKFLFKENQIYYSSVFLWAS